MGVIWSATQELSFVQTIIYISSIICLLEWVNGMRFEISSIWTKKNCVAKWHYLLSRYLNVVGHIALVIACNLLYSSPTPIPWRVCYWWHLFPILTSLIMFVLTESLAAVQARVLWDRDCYITIFLVTLVGTGFTLSVAVATLLFKHVLFMDSCEIQGFPVWMIVVPAYKVFTQMSLWGLIGVKCHKLRAPVLATLRRDVSLKSTGLILLMFCVGAHFIVAPHSAQAQKAYLILYPIFMNIMSSMNCRTIKQMHMQATPRDHISQDMANNPNPSSRILSSIVSEYWSSNSLEIGFTA